MLYIHTYVYVCICGLLVCICISEEGIELNGPNYGSYGKFLNLRRVVHVFWSPSTIYNKLSSFVLTYVRKCVAYSANVVMIHKQFTYVCMYVCIYINMYSTALR